MAHIALGAEPAGFKWLGNLFTWDQTLDTFSDTQAHVTDHITGSQIVLVGVGLLCTNRRAHRGQRDRCPARTLTTTYWSISQTAVTAPRNSKSAARGISFPPGLSAGELPASKSWRHHSLQRHRRRWLGELPAEDNCRIGPRRCGFRIMTGQTLLNGPPFDAISASRSPHALS